MVREKVTQIRSWNPVLVSVFVVNKGILTMKANINCYLIFSLAFAAAGLCHAGAGRSRPASDAAAESGYVSQQSLNDKVLLKGGILYRDPSSSNNDLLPLLVEPAVGMAVSATKILSDHIGLEFSLPYSHNDIKRKGENKVAQMDWLAPSLTAQYYFDIPMKNWQPYVGVGISYSMYDVDVDNTTIYDKISADDAWGFVGEFGVNYQINTRFFVNAAASYTVVKTDFDAVVKNNGLVVKKSLDINPWSFGLNIGMVI